MPGVLLKCRFPGSSPSWDLSEVRNRWLHCLSRASVSKVLSFSLHYVWVSHLQSVITEIIWRSEGSWGRQSLSWPPSSDVCLQVITSMCSPSSGVWNRPGSSLLMSVKSCGMSSLRLGTRRPRRLSWCFLASCLWDHWPAAMLWALSVGLWEVPARGTRTC
jgi:hypothetical protein